MGCKHPSWRYSAAPCMTLLVAPSGRAAARLPLRVEERSTRLARQREDGRHVLGRVHYEVALRRTREALNLQNSAEYSVANGWANAALWCGPRFCVERGSLCRPPHAGTPPGITCGVRSDAGGPVLQRHSAEFCRIRHLAAAWRAGSGCRAGWRARQSSRGSAYLAIRIGGGRQPRLCAPWPARESSEGME
jgi:hypothetical protein